MGENELKHLVDPLMDTLLVRCPDLLDPSDKSALEDPKFCKKDLGLIIGGNALLRPVAEGPKTSRYWAKRCGNHYVCKEWWPDNHEHNAKSLLKFVEELIERKATHSDVRELDKHRQAFEKYLRTTRPTSRITPAAEPSRPVDEIGEVPRPTRPARRSDHPRNTILYGPPGTGKTYSTLSHALAIVDGVKPKAETTEPDRQRFRHLRFTRAHDIYAELVETLGEKEAKELMIAAFGENAEGRIAMVTFHQNYAYEDFVEGIRPRLADSGEDEGESEATGTSPSSELDYELRPGIFRRICKAAEVERTEAASNSREPERFVLVIDEINRGNIPKIFGELITLIEPSRRLGADDETTVTLPYSGEDFGVPDNLYIIGTMNTADRSIQQMDTALRRRFAFVEMMPDADHDLISEDVDGVDCRPMLRAMNERIALLLDREHQIGHTYLLDVETMEQLADRFRNRIFPLLQEYFYDDWRKIRAVLGDNAFVKERKLADPHMKALVEEFGYAEDDRLYERLSSSDDEWKNPEQYKKIYARPKEN